MLVPLAAATTDTCGGKAGGLGALIRAGLPVPDGVVIPFATYDAVVAGDQHDVLRQAIPTRPLPGDLVDGLGRWLEAAGDPPVAVRSSAANEDTAASSAAGQHDSFLGVQGISAVADAVRGCWASLWSPRAITYRAGSDRASMAVIVQRHLDGEASGVMFTPADPAAATVIEAAWGLGPSVVEGRVTPDTYRVAQDGSVTRIITDKPSALERDGSHLVERAVPTSHRTRATLTDATAGRLAHLGARVAAVLGAAQDIEWTLTGDHLWLLQARPVTAPPPAAPSDPHPAALTGTPGSHGTATGPARIVHGPDDFHTVRPGDILVCRFTDPAWTPLLRIVAGVVTEIGGVLSHAAIVAREQHIPAVLGVPHAMTHLPDGTPITIDGSKGTVVSRAGDPRTSG